MAAAAKETHRPHRIPLQSSENINKPKTLWHGAKILYQESKKARGINIMVTNVPLDALKKQKLGGVHAACGVKYDSILLSMYNKFADILAAMKLSSGNNPIGVSADRKLRGAREKRGHGGGLLRRQLAM